MDAYIQGHKASDLEVRVASSLSRMEIPFRFRARLSPLLADRRRMEKVWTNTMGEIEIDFLVVKGTVTPVFVDGLIGHYYTAWQQDKDREKTDATNEYGRAVGWKEAVRIPYHKLTTQEQTDVTIRGLFQ